VVAAGHCTQYYQQKVEAGEFQHDAGQELLCAALDALTVRLHAAKGPVKTRAEPGLTSKLGHFLGLGGSKKPARKSGVKPTRGLYIWGSVGAGKTMLMDVFYADLPMTSKRRTHFHAFMQDVHARIHQKKMAVGDCLSVWGGGWMG
jgi:cell division protein ZapE